MVLEAKKEQMDTLLKELQSLKEGQLKKGTMHKHAHFILVIETVTLLHSTPIKL